MRWDLRRVFHQTGITKNLEVHQVVRKQRAKWFKRVDTYHWIRGENYSSSYHSGVLANKAKFGGTQIALLSGNIDSEQELI